MSTFPMWTPKMVNFDGSLENRVSDSGSKLKTYPKT